MGRAERGAGEAAGSVLHPFEPRLHQGGQSDDVAFGQVRQGPLDVRPRQVDRVALARRSGRTVIQADLDGS